jgi:WD40 repeat protein
MFFPFFAINSYKNSKNLGKFNVFKSLIFRCESKFFEVFKSRKLCFNKKFFGHSKKIIDLFFFIKNKFLLSLCISKKVKIWETISGRILRSFDFNSLYIKNVLIDPEGQFLVLIYKKKVIIWNIWTGLIYNIVPFTSTLISKPIFYKNSKILCILGKDNNLYFIDIVQNIILKKLIFTKKLIFIFDNREKTGKNLFQKFNFLIFFNAMFYFSKIFRYKWFKKKIFSDLIYNLNLEKSANLVVITKFIIPKVLIWDFLTRLLLKNIYFFKKKDSFFKLYR